MKETEYKKTGNPVIIDPQYRMECFHAVNLEEPSPLECFTGELSREITKCAEPEETVSFKSVRKNNGIQKEACFVRSGETKIAPAFYLDDFYDEYYKNGRTVRQIAESILYEARMSMPGRKISFDFWKDYNEVKKRLIIKLVGYSGNRELLAEVPYDRIEDMAAIYCYLMPDDGMQGGTITIRNEHLLKWGISKETLNADAFESCQTLQPVCITGICEALGMPVDNSEDDDMFVISNTSKIFGASCVLYPGVLEKFAAEKDADIFVLPSSIHEMILLPEKEDQDYSTLQNIVKETNRTEVDPEEVLSDSVYYYDREAGVLSKYLP